MLDQLEGLKQIQFLGKLNYARHLIPNLSQMAGPLYNKTKQSGECIFNNEDIKSVKKFKDIVRKIKPLELPPPNAYLVIKSNGRIGGWSAVLKFKPSKESSVKKERISRYDSGTYSMTISSTDATIKALGKFQLFVIS